MKALRRQRMTCLSGMLNLFAHCELLKTTVNYSTFSTLPWGGKHARKQNVHLKCEQIRVMFVLCRRMSLRASFDKVLRSARTYFCDQIAIINGIDLYVEAKPCLGSVERGSWGLSGEVGPSPPRPPPSRGEKFGRRAALISKIYCRVGGLWEGFQVIFSRSYK